MKHNFSKYIFGAVIIMIASSSCKKSDNPNNLPDVSASDYNGLVDGYNSSDQIFPQNLRAYWSFDNTKTEKMSNLAPTQSVGDSYVSDGVRGQALKLVDGFLYYAAQFPQFKTDSLKSWSLSVWIRILNNGSKRTMVWQMARPGMFNGNINFALNTNQFPASNTTTLKIQPTFTTIGGGTQDNLNATLSPVIGASKWVNLVLTYNYTTGVFDNWADGVKVGSYSNRGTGNNLFKSWEPSEVIIGSNYNGIPGKAVNADVSFAPMNGQLDEIRMWNITLPDAHIRALYNLGAANK